MDAVEVIDRSKFMGGSDIPVLFGLSKRKSRTQLWLEKTGRGVLETYTPQELRAFARGKKLEPYVLEMVVDKLEEQGHKVEVLATNQRYRDPVIPHFSCEVDYELLLDGEHVNGDTKTLGFRRAGAGWGTEGTDEIPAAHAGQFYWGQGITGRRRTIVSALIGLDDVRIYELPIHVPTVMAVRDVANAFWKANVVGDMPPLPLSYEDASAIFRQDSGEEFEANEQMHAAVERLRAVKAGMKELEAEEELISLAIAQYLGAKSLLMWQGQKIASWKTQDARRIDINRLRDKRPDVAQEFTVESTQRVLRLHKPKAPK